MRKIASVAELIEVTVNGQIHYLNPKNIASIKPVQGVAAHDVIRGVTGGKGSERLPTGV